jgi:hypothetical protein
LRKLGQLLNALLGEHRVWVLLRGHFLRHFFCDLNLGRKKDQKIGNSVKIKT